MFSLQSKLKSYEPLHPLTFNMIKEKVIIKDKPISDLRTQGNLNLIDFLVFSHKVEFGYS